MSLNELLENMCCGQNSSIMNESMKYILHYNHSILSTHDSYPMGCRIISCIDSITSRYQRLIEKINKSFDFVNSLFVDLDMLKRDVYNLVRREFQSINDLGVLVQVCNHSLYRNLKKQINICDIVKIKLTNISRTYSNLVYEENNILNMTLKDFVSTVSHLTQVYKQIQHTTIMLLNKSMYIEDLKNNLRHMLRNVYSILYNPQETKITRNDTLQLDFKSCQFDDHQMTNDMCCICLEDFTPTDNVILLPCNHNFHRTCITESFKYQQRCPLCRTPIQ